MSIFSPRGHMTAFKNLPGLSYMRASYYQERVKLARRETGLLMPYATVSSVKLSLSMTFFISSIGTEVAPVTPVL